MGAWGVLFDENDAAADKARDCSQALAAAEVVAAGIGKPSARLNTEIVEWASANSASAERGRARARSLLTRVRDNSELQQLWGEAEESAEWMASVDETISRLE